MQASSLGSSVVRGDASPWKIVVRLPEKANANSHGARPVHHIISMIKWFRTSRLPIKNSLSLQLVSIVHARAGRGGSGWLWRHYQKREERQPATSWLPRTRPRANTTARLVVLRRLFVFGMRQRSRPILTLRSVPGSLYDYSRISSGGDGALDGLEQAHLQRFRGGLACTAHRLRVSLNSRLASNKEEEEEQAPAER